MSLREYARTNPDRPVELKPSLMRPCFNIGTTDGRLLEFHSTRTDAVRVIEANGYSRTRGCLWTRAGNPNL